jgi:hypothetical protein
VQLNETHAALAVALLAARFQSQGYVNPIFVDSMQENSSAVNHYTWLAKGIMKMLSAHAGKCMVDATVQEGHGGTHTWRRAVQRAAAQSSSACETGKNHKCH